MKRHGDLYRKIYDFANLENAYKKARKNKRYRNEVLKYTENLEENLITLQNNLIWKSYMQGEQRIFYVIEPKKRTISALPFRDRVAHHAINNVIEPIFDKRFYAHSYACRAGKGTHAASETLTKWIRNLYFEGKPLYALKADIKSYFHSVDHERLKKLLRRVIKDADALWLLDLIVDSGGEGGRGIPVGNLTSQLFANIYLDTLDKYVKERLCVKWYLRYMDDFVILSHSKKELHALWVDIEGFLFTELGLLLNPKTTIINAKHNVDFCGYRHYRDHRKIRKRSVKSMRKKIKALYNGKMSKEAFGKSLQSWLGHIKHGDTFNLQKKILAQIESNP